MVWRVWSGWGLNFLGADGAGVIGATFGASRVSFFGEFSPLMGSAEMSFSASEISSDAGADSDSGSLAA